VRPEPADSPGRRVSLHRQRGAAAPRSLLSPLRRRCFSVVLRDQPARASISRKRPPPKIRPLRTVISTMLSRYDAVAG
jgi:hypothetical protein